MLFGKGDVFMGGYPHCLLRIVRFWGTTKSEFEDNRQALGNAFKFLKQVKRFSRENEPIVSTVDPDRMGRRTRRSSHVRRSGRPSTRSSSAYSQIANRVWAKPQDED
jgi:hypothetical protein